MRAPVHPLQSVIGDGPLAFYLWREMRSKIPQLNDKTTIELVYNSPREIQIPVQDDSMMRPYRNNWYPAKGWKAFYLRCVKRFHKWLVDNRYHPADRPANWRPMSIEHIGMIDLNFGVSPSVSVRTIRFERYMVGNYHGFPANPYDYLDIFAAYDPMSDRLFVGKR